jgi:hypothetical protein
MVFDIFSYLYIIGLNMNGISQLEESDYEENAIILQYFFW